jgi:pSer/pThr/pTyr-binding forkhead associated (FHA) protein
MTMRLSFPNKEHDDTLIGAGDTRIGAAADNTIVLNRSGVAAHHARLSVGDRGIVLHVLEGARTHVNTRPVREKAILRLGDIISLDTLQFVLKPDRDDSIRSNLPASSSITPPPPVADPAAQTRINPSRVLLRGVSGAHFGKIVAVRSKLVIGRGADADLVLDEPNMEARHAVIETVGDAIYLRDFNSRQGARVNGVPVHDAVLHSGDQIAFERNRFVLEAPGLPSRSESLSALPAYAPAMNVTQTMQAIRLPEDPPAPADSGERSQRGSKNDIWWLIVAAALIAGGLALLFLIQV